MPILINLELCFNKNIMKNSIKVIILVLFVSLLSNCKKNQTGGNASVSGTVSHHTKAIANARVYIKFNSSEFPGDDYTKYDTYVDADSEGKYKISLYKGTYYLYAKGYDLDIPAPYIVKGGLSVSVRTNEKVQKDLAVTED